jgi:phosphomannomutase/phosphoglucomutase
MIKDLPDTFNSPTMSPECADNVKYQTIDKISEIIRDKYENKIKIADQEILSILTINGIRFTLEDGSWGLIRASSNKPNLVVVCESTSSEYVMREIFKFIDNLLKKFKEIGPYDQSI